MSSIKTLKDARDYGGRHLVTINEDVQCEEGYSRKSRNDMNRAIGLLQESPEMFELLCSFVGFIQAGPNEPWMERKLARANDIISKIKSL